MFEESNRADLSCTNTIFFSSLTQILTPQCSDLCARILSNSPQYQYQNNSDFKYRSN